MKKTQLMATLLALVLSLGIVLVPAYAANPAGSNTEEYTRVAGEFTEIDISDDAINGMDSVFVEAYIDFTKKLSELGISPKMCYEDFVHGYQYTMDNSLQIYTEKVVEAEIAMNANNDCGKNFQADCSHTTISQPIPQSAVLEEEIEVLNAYENMVTFFDASGGNISLAYDDFYELYKMSSFETPQEFVDHVSKQFDMVSYSSWGSQWYDNIGTQSPKLPQKASYGSTYNLLGKVQKGDIIQETGGGIALITGHIAIVEGTFYDAGQSQL